MCIIAFICIKATALERGELVIGCRPMWNGCPVSCRRPACGTVCRRASGWWNAQVGGDQVGGGTPAAAAVQPCGTVCRLATKWVIGTPGVRHPSDRCKSAARIERPCVRSEQGAAALRYGCPCGGLVVTPFIRHPFDTGLRKPDSHPPPMRLQALMWAVSMSPNVTVKFYKYEAFSGGYHRN